MLALLFGLDGRMSRLTWWLTRLGVYPAAIATAVVLYTLIYFLSEGTLRLALERLVMLLFALSVAWFELATSVKRLHDLDLSGWFYLVSLVPLVGVIFYLVVLGCLPGTRGRNQFGSPPGAKATDRAADVFT